MRTDLLVDRIYQRLNGGNFGSTSKDCIRAVLHASELEAERDRLRRALTVAEAYVQAYVPNNTAALQSRGAALDQVAVALS